MLESERPSVVIRQAHRPGDLGWVVMAHGEQYAAEFGWNTEFEALVARIVADFAADHDPSGERAWLAEMDGHRVGCVFCVRKDNETAQLRILLVTTTAVATGLAADWSSNASTSRVPLDTADWCCGPMIRLLPPVIFTLLPALLSSTKRRTTASASTSSVRTISSIWLETGARPTQLANSTRPTWPSCFRVTRPRMRSIGGFGLHSRPCADRPAKLAAGRHAPSASGESAIRSVR